MIWTCSLKRWLIFQFCGFLTILLFLVQGNHCMIPQVSEEDSLRSFKSYSDVTIFHYTIPKEVLRATWQFAAFMDDPSCQPRKVHIHLRFGSYPIISTENRTSSANVIVEHDDAIIVSTTATYKPRNSTVVPIYGPEAGDWFVGAYMSPWDERVQQQGLGHKCRYSIGTVVLWSQMDGIKNIPIGYDIMLQTSATVTYYKVYIPSGVSAFRLSIWNCNFTLHSLHDSDKPCIESVSLKGRALPIRDKSEKSVSLTTHAGHTFVESSPHEDSYYYMLIVSNSIIKFSVRIDISECPVRVMEKYFTREYLNTGINLNSVARLDSKNSIKDERYYRKGNVNSSYHDKNFTELYKKDQLYRKNKEQNTQDFCMPRHQLVRVKHTEIFSTVHLLQGYEWLSSRLLLTDALPIMIQFNILPLLDIGGTLDVSARLDAGKIKMPSNTLISIRICVQRSRIPKLYENHSWPNELLSLSLSSLDKHNASLLIPYPQPGMWYIIIHTMCYNYNNPAYCQLEEIPLLLNVRTRKCVFANPSPCGDHGVCREIKKNSFHYTTCTCFEGYTGYGCTDTLNATATISFLISAMMLILSNIFFIPAIYLAVKRELYVEGLVYLATMLSSSFYHACDQNDERFCVVKYEVLQYSDFFCSILAFWVTLVAMAKLKHNCASICHMIGVFVITIGVQINKTCLISTIIPLSMGIIILIFMYIYRNFQTRNWKKPNRKTLVGLLFAIIGLSLYSFVETEGNYRYIHSAWHIIMATSLIFLLPSKQSTLSRSASLKDVIVQRNCKEHRGPPTFMILDRETEPKDI